MRLILVLALIASHIGRATEGRGFMPRVGTTACHVMLRD